MVMVRFRVRYPQVLCLVRLDTRMIFHLRFSGSGSEKNLVWFFNCGYPMDNHLK